MLKNQIVIYIAKGFNIEKEWIIKTVNFWNPLHAFFKQIFMIQYLNKTDLIKTISNYWYTK